MTQEKKTIEQLIHQVRSQLQPFWTLVDMVKIGNPIWSPFDMLKEATTAYEQKVSILQALDTIQELSEECRYSEEDMIAAYWGGIEGSINDYSEVKTVGSEMIGIKSGGGAKKWLTEYNAAK